MAIGIFYCRRMRSVSDYILGSRSLGTWVTSMSAEAADMSGWLMLGLPGYAYCAGMQAGWIALGLMIGTYINWKAVAGRLRTYTQVANQRTIRTVPVNGLTPEATSYPYERNLYYAYQQPASPQVQAFLGYVFSPLGQQILNNQ